MSVIRGAAFLIVGLVLMQGLLFPPVQPSMQKTIRDTHHPASFSNGPMNSSWPMCCHDTRHTGLSPYPTANTPDVIKWRIKTDWVDGGIAIDNNGILYFGSNDNHLNAAYSNGTMKWRFKTGGWIETTPAIGEDGAIYAGCWDYYLYALNPNGTERWRYNCQSPISEGSPLIGPDGTIYVTTIDPKNYLLAINPTGTLKWKYQAGSWMTSAPALALDGTIIFGSTDTYVYAINPNGTLHWKYKTGNEVQSSASIATNGTIYMPSSDGYLYALNPTNGKLFWRCAMGYGSCVNPSIGPDGAIYTGCDTLYAVSPNGTLRWQVYLGGKNYIGWSSPAISADGIIYFGTEYAAGDGGEIFAVNSNGTIRWHQQIANYWVDSCPAIGSDGTIYIGCAYQMDLGYLYAFGNGPLIAEAHGPYSGYAASPIQFNAEAFGGRPPYTYSWDFGDGQSSNDQNPTHSYNIAGNFTATLTVTDTTGNHTTDTATVHISYSAPTITITTPTNGIYIGDNKIMNLRKYCIAIGPITIEASATQVPLGIDHVEFYLDGQLQATVTQPPYTYRWIHGHSKHTISATAYDTAGDHASAHIYIWKI